MKKCSVHVITLTSDLCWFCLQRRRDILTETKYIELVLVADHQEVRESVCSGSSADCCFIH